MAVVFLLEKLKRLHFIFVVSAIHSSRNPPIIVLINKNCNKYIVLCPYGVMSLSQTDRQIDTQTQQSTPGPYRKWKTSWTFVIRNITHTSNLQYKTMKRKAITIFCYTIQRLY